MRAPGASREALSSGVMPFGSRTMVSRPHDGRCSFDVSVRGHSPPLPSICHSRTGRASRLSCPGPPQAPKPRGTQGT
eukprot:1099645-Prorocentrum_minimum.AAC.2